MSLLSRNQLGVFLCAEDLSLQYLSGLLRTKILHQQHIAFKQSAENPWRVAMQCFDLLLSKIKIPAHTHLKVTLASECVRYLILPAQHTTTSFAEKNAYAEAFYREIYGDLVNDWEIRFDDPPPHIPALSVAIDRFLLEGFKQIAEKYTLKLVSVEPYIMTAVNHLKHEIGSADGYLTIIENQRLMLIQLNKGNLINLKSDAIHDNWYNTLHQLLVRESLLIDEDSPIDSPATKQIKNAVLLLYAPNIESHHIQKIAGWPVKVIGVQSTTKNMPNVSISSVSAQESLV